MSADDVRERPPIDPAVLEARRGRPWSLRVVVAKDVTRLMRRVELTGDNLDEFAPRPGQEIVLQIPQDGGEPARRHYTIRRFDRAQERIDVDFVLHGHVRRACEWARHAKAGDAIDIRGPRGRIALAPCGVASLLRRRDRDAGDFRADRGAAQGREGAGVPRNRPTRARRTARYAGRCRSHLALAQRRAPGAAAAPGRCGRGVHAAARQWPRLYPRRDRQRARARHDLLARGMDRSRYIPRAIGGPAVSAATTTSRISGSRESIPPWPVTT